MLRFANFEFDETRAALRGPTSEAIKLRPKPLAMLQVLLANAGRTLSKDELMHAVWPDVHVSEDSLFQCIREIRAALGDSDRQLIKRVSGGGYIFAAPMVTIPQGGDRLILGEGKTASAPSPSRLLPLPDKPSIAVLPFQNMSGDPDQDYFADGIVEDIITALAQSRALFVIARNSSFIYKGQTADIRRVGRELGVRYVLEGSIRTDGNRVRVTSQLIEAETGGHVWAERYDRPRADVFAVQDEITQRVAAAIAPAIMLSEGERALRRPSTSLSAWEAYHRGLWHQYKFEPDEIEKAKACFQKAIDLDPQFAAAYAQLGYVLVIDRTEFGYPPEVRAQLMSRALDLIHRAIALDPADATAHAAFASALLVSGRHEDALAEAHIALDLAPNSAAAHGRVGITCLYSERHVEALEALEMAIRLSPIDPLNPHWLSQIARTHYRMGNYEQAISIAQGVCRTYPNRIPPHLTLVAALGQIGEAKKAQDVVRHARRTIGDFFLQPGSRSYWPEQLPEHRAHIDEGLRRAGFTAAAPSSSTSAPPRLSIVVLPFANIGGGPEQDYFVDGVTESLTTDLSRLAGSFVIARNTASTYKGQPYDVTKIGRELDVRYVLEGSVQRGGNRMRVNVQLIDAGTGHHLWAARFDKHVGDLFDMQDEIVARLANELSTALIAQEARRAVKSPNPDSMDHYFQGTAWYEKSVSRENVRKARDCFERALALDPDNVDALVGLGFMDAAFGIGFHGDDREMRLASAEASAQRALSLAPDHALGHVVLGAVYVHTSRAEESIAEFERAIELDHNLALAHSWIGAAKAVLGRAEETEAHVGEALRLSPKDSLAYSWFAIAGAAKLCLRAYEEAAAWLCRSIEANRNYIVARLYLAAALAHLGRIEEARSAAKAGLALDPTYTIQTWRRRIAGGHRIFVAQMEHIIDGIRLAGVPEE